MQLQFTEKRKANKDYKLCLKHAAKRLKHTEEEIQDYIENPSYFKLVEDTGTTDPVQLEDGDRCLWLGPKKGPNGGISHELEAFHGKCHGWATADQHGNPRVWLR